MKRNKVLTIGGVLFLLLGLISCVKQQSPSSLNFSGLLVHRKAVYPKVEPGSYAFYSFIQHLSAPSTDSSQAILFEEAKAFLPDSVLHQGLNLFGVEIAYTDSIRLLYHECTSAIPPESHAYLTSFTKGGSAIEVLTLKEASFNGNAAVNLIDGDLLELEYYNVYDAMGRQEEELAFEYYQILADGQLHQLSTPGYYSQGRKYMEASARLLSIDELKRYELRELAVMEMELLAEYGQIFSDRKWNSYFNRKDWYHARTDNAEVLLSDLEKVNLRKIRLLQVNF